MAVELLVKLGGKKKRSLRKVSIPMEKEGAITPCCWYFSSVAKSCPTLSDPMNCSPPGSSVHKLSQARRLERVAISFSKGSSWPRDWTCLSYTVGKFFTTKPPGKPVILFLSRIYITLEGNVDSLISWPYLYEASTTQGHSRDISFFVQYTVKVYILKNI